MLVTHCKNALLAYVAAPVEVSNDVANRSCVAKTENEECHILHFLHSVTFHMSDADEATPLGEDNVMFLLANAGIVPLLISHLFLHGKAWHGVPEQQRGLEILTACFDSEAFATDREKFLPRDASGVEAATVDGCPFCIETLTEACTTCRRRLTTLDFMEALLEWSDDGAASIEPYEQRRRLRPLLDVVRAVKKELPSGEKATA